jgi:hypothetical protein
LNGTDKGYLTPIAYDGQTNTDPDGNTIIVTDLNQLSSAINATVPTSTTGNLIGDLGGNYGADGAGHVNAVEIAGITKTYDDGDINHMVTITLAQGTFTVNMQTGAYTYQPTVGQHQTEVDVIFNLSDKEGDVSAPATLRLIPDNHAPVIDSNGGGANASVTISENSTAVTTVHAADTDLGDKVSYAITGGADKNLFTIDAAGHLAFKSAPDFENPSDSGHDNTYVVAVTASDLAGATDTQTITVTVKDVNETPVAGDDFVYTTQTNNASLQDGWLLSNDKDPEGHSLTVTGVNNDQNLDASHSGTVVSLSGLFGSGNNDGEMGTFDYSVKDGSVTGTGHVTVTYESSSTIDRSADTHNDIIIGSSADETLKGGHGDDVIVTGGGNDKVDGGDGFNTAVIAGNGVSYSHTTLAANFHNVQLLDLGKGGNNDDTAIGANSDGSRLDAKDVLDIAGANHALYITGDSSDDVSVKTSGSNAFSGGTSVNVNGVDHVPDGSYNHYTATVGGQQVDLYVQTAIDQHKGG